MPLREVEVEHDASAGWHGIGELELILFAEPVTPGDHDRHVDIALGETCEFSTIEVVERDGLPEARSIEQRRDEPDAVGSGTAVLEADP